MKRPRALVFSSLSPATGCGLRALYLVRALGRLGWDARLVAPRGKPLPLGAEQFPAVLAMALAGLAPVDLAVAIKPYPNAWLGLAAARLRGAVTVVDVDDVDDAYRGFALATLSRALQAPAFGVAHFASTHHPRLRQGLLRRVGDRVLNLAQGVDLELFDYRRCGPSRTAWRRRQGLSRTTVLAFTAHLNVACRLGLLLDCLGPWLGKHPKAVLVVAGGGPWEGRFRRRAAPYGGQIRFTGYLSPRQSAEILAGADCLVAAYGAGKADRHRVPMKVGEALAMGLPVVTHAMEGITRMLPYVYVARPGAANYGAALDAALRFGRARARRGRDWVRRDLDWTRVAADFLDQIRRRRPLPKGLNEA